MKKVKIRLPIDQNIDKKIVCIFSGGLDSTTLLYWLLFKGANVSALTFDYGQRHSREILAAKETCKALKVNHEIIDISSLKNLMGQSSLTSNKKVPHGHYQEESMKDTVVPNRNSILLNLAIAYGVCHKIYSVAYGAHAGDHAIYPDCRPKFVRAIKKLALTVDYNPIKVISPFLYMSKTEIVALGNGLGVDYMKTWTCYEGKKRPCGKCGSCVERLEAFEMNNLIDPLTY